MTVEQARKPGTGRLRPVLLLTVVLVLAASVTIPALSGGFVSDDLGLIVNNPQLAARNPTGLFTHRFASGAVTAYRLNVSYYRPLTSLSFWLDRQLWGLRPFPYHLHNVLLNLVAVALVFLILNLLLASPVAAALGGLLFAAHPMHAESIAYVSGRTDLLMTVFVLGSFYFLLRSTRRTHTVLAAAAFALALLAKETAVMFALFCLLWALTRRKGRLAATILLALAAGFFVLRAGLLGSSFRLTPDVSAGQFPALMLNTLGLYVKSFFFPFVHQPYYPFRADFLSVSGYGVLALCIIILAVVAAGVRIPDSSFGLRRSSFLPGFWWALLLLLPVLNLLFLSGPLAAERFLYAPSFGFVWLLVAGLHELVRGRRRPAVVLSAAGLIATVAMGANLAATVPTWHDELRLAEARVRTAPGFAMSHNSLGVALRARNQVAAAGEQFARAVALKPDYAEAHNNLAAVKETQGDVTGATAEYRLAVQYDSTYVLAHNNLGAIYGTRGETDSAIVQFKTALRLDPANAEAHNNLGVVFYARGEAPLARAEFNRALVFRPDYVRALVNLARLEIADGNRDAARNLLERARRVAPSDAQVQALLQSLVR